MGYNDFKYEIEVRDQRSMDGFSSDGSITIGCHVIIYDAGTKTKSTIYGDAARLAKTNDITRTAFAVDGKILFWSPKISHDIFVSDSLGNNVFAASVTPGTRTVRVHTDGIEKCLFFPMVFNAGGTVVDTGLDLPAKAHVHNLAVEVIDVDATETVDIGLLAGESGGDEDGFIAAMSVAVAGFVKPYVNTAGGNETFVSTAKFGVLMGPSLVGTDVDKDTGVARGWGHVGDGTAKSITYTPSTSDTFTGYGYVFYRQLR